MESRHNNHEIEIHPEVWTVKTEQHDWIVQSQGVKVVLSRSLIKIDSACIGLNYPRGRNNCVGIR